MNKDIEQYLAAVSPDRRSKQIITSSFLLATIDMKYKMPTYHLGEGWVAIANPKNDVFWRTTRFNGTDLRSNCWQ